MRPTTVEAIVANKVAIGVLTPHSRNTKPRYLQSFRVITGAGFEPATFGV